MEVAEVNYQPGGRLAVRVLENGKHLASAVLTRDEALKIRDEIDFLTSLDAWWGGAVELED